MAIASDCFIDLAMLLERMAEEGMGDDIVFEPDGTTVCGDRVVELALLLQRHAEIAKIRRVMWVLFYRPTDPFDGRAVSACLTGRNTEKVQGIGMIRSGRQHPTVASLGLD